jgi:hypothetical protein
MEFVVTGIMKTRRIGQTDERVQSDCIMIVVASGRKVLAPK